MRYRKTVIASALAVAILLTGTGALAANPPRDDDDPGLLKTILQFGVIKGLDQSSAEDIDAATATANPLRLATLAKGLKARVVTSGNAASNLDMLDLFPPQHPTHIIACNEQGTTGPGVQRIDLATGVATTIVTGL